MNKWTIISFFIDSSIKKENPTILKITKNFYIINNLKANILIGMDILYLEKIIINLPINKILFRSYENIAILVKYTL